MKMIEVGQRIQERRKVKGLTQSELADASGLSTMSIRRYESGERIAPEKALSRIAAALGVSYNYLMGYEKRKTVIPDRLWMIQTELPDANDIILNVEAADPEALSYGLELLENASDGAARPAVDRLIQAFLSLNSEGQAKAVERVEELLEIARFRNESVN